MSQERCFFICYRSRSTITKNRAVDGAHNAYGLLLIRSLFKLTLELFYLCVVGLYMIDCTFVFAASMSQDFHFWC